MNDGTAVAVICVVTLLVIGAFSALKQRSFARAIAARAPHRHQLIPEATQEDIERIVRRDFPGEQFEQVSAILKQYNSRWQDGGVRVRLAALKLANGSAESLEKHIAAATQDFRDILVAAEYPEYWKAKFRVRRLSSKDSQRLMDADWKQYQNWLRM